MKQTQLKILLLFAAFFGLIEVSAQQMFFSGLVVDSETNQPLVGATLAAIGLSGNVGQTDVSGKFLISTSSQTALYRVTFFGYENKTVSLSINAENRIELSPLKYNLQELVIEEKRNVERGAESMVQISIDRDLLKRNSAAGLGEVLSQIDGVNFISTGANIQLPVIHGLYGNRILILNNGFKHGFQNWGTDHAPEVDVTGAEVIKVVKGAAGVKYGPDALGGAVILENNPMLPNNPFYLCSTSSYQTNGRGYGTNLSFGQGWKNFSYHVGGNFNQVGDRRAPRYRLTNTGAVESAFQAGVRFSHEKWVLKANYSMVDQDLGILRASIGASGPALIRNMEADIPTFIRDFSYDINPPNQVVNHQLASAELNRYFNNGSQLIVRYARQWNSRVEFDVRRNPELPILDLDLLTDDLQAEWNHSLSEKWTGTFGIQYFTQENSNNPGTRVTPFIPNYRLSRWSAFALESYEYSKTSTWEFGLRFDYETSTVAGRDSRQVEFRDNFSFGNFTAVAGNIKKLNPKTTLRNNLGSGWRPPNMAELFSFGQHEAQTIFGLLRYEPAPDGRITAARVIPLSELNIAPENSLKYTSELEWQSAGHRLSVTAYANYIRNFIFARPIGVLGTARGPMPTFIYDQADALFLGSDITYTKNYHENGKITFGASYIWTRNVERGETLINQPPIHLHSRLNHAFHKIKGIDKLDFFIQPTYTFVQFQAPRVLTIRELVEGTETVTIDDPIFDFLAPPPGYFLLHGGVAIQKGKFDLSFEARNILNHSYRDYLNNMRYFADELGINLIFSLTYKL
jgi:iron complex outermembrane receptor protein